MFNITFYRFEPATKEDIDELLYNKRILGFIIKEDTTEEVQKFVNWIGNLTPYEDHMGTYIIITGKILNKYYSDFYDYETLYPDDLTFVAFDLDEMEDSDMVVGNIKGKNNFWMDQVILGVFMEDTIKEWEKINDL